MAAIMSKQMVFMMPIMTIVIGAGLPSGLVLYWLVITVITALQQILVLKFSKEKKKPEPPSATPPLQPVIEIKPIE
jgi:membrane protein insertase Oxa1/YidC/SpoIIIJ